MAGTPHVQRCAKWPAMGHKTFAPPEATETGSTSPQPAVQTLHLRLQDPGPASGVALSLGARRGHPGLQRPSLL